MTPPKLTLLTCTHNGEQTIQQTIEKIANQTDVPQDILEVLVVDNTSTDRTSKLAEDAIKHFRLKGRVLLEPKIGKINAFLKGVNEAKGELISIIDDDNFIEPGFIHYTINIFERFPHVGMTGSANKILTDQPLPTWFAWTSGRYACSPPWLDEIVEHTSDGIIIAKTAIIHGAGSTFRTTLLQNCLNKGYRFFNDTQRGKIMKVAGEDTELCWLIRSLGYCFAHDPRIQIRHAIEPERLTLENFEHLCRSVGAGSLGYEPFMFTYKHTGNRLSIKWTWQWQLLAKLKRYLYLALFPENSGQSNEERIFKNWRARVECMGAIRRILAERENYTNHIRQVACGDWTEFRVR